MLLKRAKRLKAVKLLKRVKRLKPVKLLKPLRNVGHLKIRSNNLYLEEFVRLAVNAAASHISKSLDLTICCSTKVCQIYRIQNTGVWKI